MTSSPMTHRPQNNTNRRLFDCAFIFRRKIYTSGFCLRPSFLFIACIWQMGVKSCRIPSESSSANRYLRKSHDPRLLFLGWKWDDEVSSFFRSFLNYNVDRKRFVKSEDEKEEIDLLIVLIFSRMDLPKWGRKSRAGKTKMMFSSNFPGANSSVKLTKKFRRITIWGIVFLFCFI